MTLSDELLRTPEKLKALRRELAAAAESAGAQAAFLLDEAGEPFATVGTIEFTLPTPVASHSSLLSALVGQPNEGSVPDSPYVVGRVTSRALVVLVFASCAEAGAKRRHVKPLAAAIRSALDG